ncbi:MAG: hypothetical protein AMXMBFR84_15840 [Candidatus Hydrogenedentota bacterium]
MSRDDVHALFAYGTLLDPPVQRELFGRIVDGTPDTLTGFSRTTVEVQGSVYPDLRPKPGGRVEGRVLLLTTDDLHRADAYETDAYIREQLILESGRAAWVYHT